jgi:hypothetical protein
MPGAIELLIAQARASRQTSLRLSAITAFDMAPAGREKAPIYFDHITR